MYSAVGAIVPANAGFGYSPDLGRNAPTCRTGGGNLAIRGTGRARPAAVCRPGGTRPHSAGRRRGRAVAQDLVNRALGTQERIAPFFGTMFAWGESHRRKRSAGSVPAPLAPAGREGAKDGRKEEQRWRITGST